MVATWRQDGVLWGGHVEILSDLDGDSVWWPRGDKMGFYGVATWRYYKGSE